MKTKHIIALSSLLLTLSCNSATHSGSMNQQPQQLSGAWEFQLFTTPTPDSTETIYIETVLTPNGSQFSALNNDLTFITDTKLPADDFQFGRICMSGQDAFSGQVDGNNNVALTFSDPIDSFTATGQVSGSSVSGNYTSSTSNDCPYSGSFTGRSVTPLSGTFSGTLWLNGATDTVTVSLTQSNLVLTLAGSSVGTDNASFTLQGAATANSFQAEGSIGSNNVSLVGLYIPSESAIHVSVACVPNEGCSNGYNPAGTLTVQ